METDLLEGIELAAGLKAKKIEQLFSNYNIKTEAIEYVVNDNAVYLSGELITKDGYDLAAHEMMEFHQELKTLGDVHTDLTNWVMTNLEIVYVQDKNSAATQ